MRKFLKTETCPMTTKPFDIVIHGSTGFTGRLVAEYMVQRYPNAGNAEGIRWAMGGRSLEKLQAVRDEIGAPADTPLVVTDTSKPDSLQALMSSTRVVLTTVGPYQLYGNEMVAACAKAGVDYVDLCGEPAWMRQMIDAHEASAKASGARIVFSCGFDSIPFDLGVYMLQQAFKARYGSVASRVRGRVRKMKGTFSGGTAASLKATMAAAGANPDIIALLKNPFSLTPGFEGPKQPHGAKPMIDEALGDDIWVAPFVMAAINTRNVHRSNFLMGHAYGADFVYDEMLITGAGDKGKAIAEHVAADKSLASNDGPKPGEGPSKAEREAGHYDVLFVGDDAQGNRLSYGVKGDRDPGYGSTSKMIAESAVCLVRDVAKSEGAKAAGGGIYTPAPIFGEKLVARLQASAGLQFAAEG
jgi:short subunit dehydrogenase-like uncharacterized protein